MEAPDFEKAVHEELGKVDVARQRFSAGPEAHRGVPGLAEEAGDAFDVLDALEFDLALHETEVSLRIGWSPPF